MNKKKLLALLMALVMTLTLVPVTALAEFNSSSVTWDYSLQNDYYEDVTSATIGVGNVVNAWISSDTDGYKVSSAVSSDVSVARLVDYTYEADGDGHWNVKVQEDWIQPWNENGELYIEGVSEGTAYIEQTIVDENDAFVDKVAFTVIVGDSIFVSANQVSITEGYTKADAVIGTPFTLHAVVSPENATYNTVTWSTADASVATISQDGNTVTVTPVAVGTVGITATCDGPNPHSAVCSITVTAPAPVESGAVRVYNGDTFVSGHATLAEAINAAQSGDTVKLFEDVAVSSSTSLSTSLILDLNGHTINSSATLFNMYSSVVELTIKDSGGNGAIDVAAEKGIYVSSGKLTLESGALEVHSSNSYTYGVQVGSSGTFVMTGGSITIPTSSTSTYNYPVNNSGTVNISGGAITAHGSGGNYAVNSSGGTVTISGGSFEAHAYAAGFKSPYVLYGSGSKTVTGGYFKAVGNEATYNAGHFVDGNGTTISGGYFGGEYYDGLDSKYIADGYTNISTDQSSLERKAGYRYKVVPYVAHVIIGNQYVKSATLADAFTAANAAGTATIQVIADCAITEPLAVGANSNITLTINEGVTVTAASTAGSNVTSTANGSYLTSQNACGYTLIQNNGRLTINGDGTIDATQIQSITDPDKKGLTQYLINNDGTITITSGTFKMYPAIKSVVLRSKGTANLNGGSFSAWSAVLNDDGGEMTVNGGTYRGWAYSGNAAGYRYAFAQYGTDSRLTINNGDFKGVHGTLGVSVGHTEVKGGTFETRPITAAMISSGDAPAGVSATTNTYHTVYAAGERGVVDITINDGEFYNAGSGYVLFIGNDSTPGDGGIGADASAHVTGGTFTQRNNSNVLYGSKNTGSIEITGGTYVGAKFNGTSYVANGYSAYQTAVDGNKYTYKIGVVKDKEVEKNTESSTDEKLVYTGSKNVYESQNSSQAIKELSSITVNVYPSNVDDVDNTKATKAPAALTNVTDTAMTNLVSVAVDKAPTEGNSQDIDVTIQVAKSAGTITENKAVYEVHPEAVIRTGTTVLGTVRLSNDQIQNTFSFKLDVTGAFNAGDSVFVTNTHANGTSDVYGPFEVTEDGGKQIVEVTGVTKFSEVVVTPASDGAVSFNGAGLRRRVRTVNNEATDEVVNTTTDIRFSFSWEKPTNATGIYINENDVNGSYFEWRKSGSNQWRKVYIKAASDDTANLVICEVPKGAFGTNIEVKAHLVFETTNGYVSVDSGIYTRSITQVATSLAENNAVADKWRAYGNHLLDNLPGGYRLSTYGENPNG